MTTIIIGSKGVEAIIKTDLTKPDLAKELALDKQSIASLANMINRDWSRQGKGVNYGAKPYLTAMSCLSTVNDNFGADSGRSVVAYFLSNAATWKGDLAKAIKKELNKRIK